MLGTPAENENGDPATVVRVRLAQTSLPVLLFQALSVVQRLRRASARPVSLFEFHVVQLVDLYRRVVGDECHSGAGTGLVCPFHTDRVAPARIAGNPLRQDGG